MATGSFNGTIYALQATPVLSTLPGSKYAGAVLYCMTDEVYASGSSLDSASLMYVGKLPAGAVVKYSVVWPIDTATFGAPDAMTNAVSGDVGISGDTDLFGSFTDLNASALPQTFAPKPDGTTYTVNTDFALDADVDVYITTGSAALTATEGIAIHMFYTMG